MFVDHFPAPFARFFDLVFRTVLAKLYKFEKSPKKSPYMGKKYFVVSKNIAVECSGRREDK